MSHFVLCVQVLGNLSTYISLRFSGLLNTYRIFNYYENSIPFYVVGEISFNIGGRDCDWRLEISYYIYVL